MYKAGKEEFRGRKWFVRKAAREEQTQAMKAVVEWLKGWMSSRPCMRGGGALVSKVEVS